MRNISEVSGLSEKLKNITGNHQMKLNSILLPGIDPKRPVVIAGPCSAESEEQTLKTAKQLVEQGVQIFRAGIWKPRTKPGGFEGVGSEGLSWLQRVKRETGMYTSTEVATYDHVFEAVKAGVDILWIGARTVVNPFAVQEVAEALRGTDVPVLVKNPVNPDLELWIGALERLHRVGVYRLGVVHRGFSTYDKSRYRNDPFWQIPIEMRRRFPNLPIFCDPSHIAGRRDLIAGISQQAMDLGFDGLLVESHFDPDAALSDAQQQLTPEHLNEVLVGLVVRNENRSSEELSELRCEIDRIDEQVMTLLARRMKVSEEIGLYKKEHDMPILQPARYAEILEKRADAACSLDLNPDFVREVLKAVHEESVRCQMEIMNR